MNVHKVLSDLGLSVGESKVYLSLLKSGSVQVSKIKESTRLHRTTIYDFLEKLETKGLVHYVVKNNVKFYNATDAHKLLDYVKEKQNAVQDVLPELLSLQNSIPEKLSVEVYSGLEGVKTLLRDILRHGKDYVIFGIDEAMFEKRMGTFMDQFFLEQKRIGFKERILTSDAVKYVYSYDTACYRYLSPESFNPTPTYVWGDNVAILIWEPLTVIKIANADLADSYTKYFEILWAIAKRKPKSAVLKKRKK
jgi:predicted transcriptional regulator